MSMYSDAVMSSISASYVEPAIGLDVEFFEKMIVLYFCECLSQGEALSSAQKKALYKTVRVMAERTKVFGEPLNQRRDFDVLIESEKKWGGEWP